MFKMMVLVYLQKNSQNFLRLLENLKMELI
jgi:hypothetical protein